MWALLYAKVRQADAGAWRNLLLRRLQIFAPRLGNDPKGAGARVLYAEGRFDLDAVRRALVEFGLPPDTPHQALDAVLGNVGPDSGQATNGCALRI